MKTTSKGVPIITAFVLLIMSLIACTKEGDMGPLKNKTSAADLMASMNMQQISPQTKAPDFELLSVTGEKVSLSRQRGKVVLLSFWTTW